MTALILFTKGHRSVSLLSRNVLLLTERSQTLCRSETQPDASWPNNMHVYYTAYIYIYITYIYLYCIYKKPFDVLLVRYNLTLFPNIIYYVFTAHYNSKLTSNWNLGIICAEGVLFFIAPPNVSLNVERKTFVLLWMIINFFLQFIHNCPYG